MTEINETFETRKTTLDMPIECYERAPGLSSVILSWLLHQLLPAEHGRHNFSYSEEAKFLKLNSKRFLESEYVTSVFCPIQPWFIHRSSWFQGILSMIFQLIVSSSSARTSLLDVIHGSDPLNQCQFSINHSAMEVNTLKYISPTFSSVPHLEFKNRHILFELKTSEASTSTQIYRENIGHDLQPPSYIKLHNPHLSAWPT